MPSVRPRAFVVTDNLACHKSAIERLAYSPDLNPIERLFSKRKAQPRRRRADG
jgi:transposase